MIKKILSAAFITALSSQAHAACFQDDTFNTTCSPATQYEIEIQQVELCRSSSCANPVIVSSSAASFDISAAGVGAAVGEYADLDDVPAGVYTHVRTTISPSITFSADAEGFCTTAVNGSVTTYNTTTVPASELSSNSSFNISWNSGNTAFEHLHELSTSVAISKAGSLPQIQVDFATQEAALCIGPSGSANLFAGVPDISIRVIAN